MSRNLNQKTVVCEGHACMPLSVTASIEPLLRYHLLGVDFVSINVGMDFTPFNEVIQVIANYRRQIEHHPHLVTVGTSADLIKAKSEGKMTVGFDLEGSDMLRGDINMVDVFYRLGVRQMLLAYNKNNEAAGGCQDKNVGLSQLGKSIISRMNQVGMIVDLSHMSENSTFEAMACSNSPAIFSHSNPKGVLNCERNITDAQIKACASQGGVVGVTGVGKFLAKNYSIDSHSIFQHVDYLVELVGSEHVSIGLDYMFDLNEMFELMDQFPELYPPEKGYSKEALRFASPEQLIELYDLMVSHGYGKSDVSNILGESYWRVAKTVWI